MIDTNKILNTVWSAVNRSGARISDAKRAEITRMIYQGIKSTENVVSFSDGYGWRGGFRDPSFCEVEDGCGGVFARWTITNPVSGDRSGTLVQRADGWFFDGKEVEPKWHRDERSVAIIYENEKS